MVGKTVAKFGNSGVGLGAGFGIVAAGAVVGGYVGNYIGDKIIKDDTAGDFVDEDGNFLQQKATEFKKWTTTAGVGGGACIGTCIAASIGLFSNPVGWTIGLVTLGVFAVGLVGAWIRKKH